MQGIESWRQRLRRLITHPAFEATLVVAVIALACWSMASVDAPRGQSVLAHILRR